MYRTVLMTVIGMSILGAGCADLDQGSRSEKRLRQDEVQLAGSDGNFYLRGDSSERTTPHIIAFRELFNSTDAVERFVRVFRTSKGLAGKLYALVGLYALDPGTFERLSAELDPSAKIHEVGWDVSWSETVGEFLNSVPSGHKFYDLYQRFDIPEPKAVSIPPESSETVGVDAATNKSNEGRYIEVPDERQQRKGMYDEPDSPP